MRSLRPSDKILARRMQAGDEDSFEEFFGEHFPRIYRFALVRLGYDRRDAEEVTQAALCKAISKIGTYQGEASLFTWLCTFCRHEIYALRRRRNKPPIEVELAEDLPASIAALESLSALFDEGPERSLRRKEIARLVQVTLDHLPSHYGNALEWKYIEGVGVKEIAGRLGMTAKAAESLLSRARAAFRDGFSSLISVPPPAARKPC